MDEEESARAIRAFEALGSIRAGERNSTCRRRVHISREQLRESYPTALATQNVCKNRYENILPEELSRVRLRYVENDRATDYINANYIWGTGDASAPPFIATQAPLLNTAGDFWLMVFEQRAPVIVMLTRLVERTRQKAHLYWPVDVNTPHRFGSIVVILKEQYRDGHIHVREFELEFAPKQQPTGAGDSSKLYDSLTHRVSHLQYTEWPDFDVPTSTHGMRQIITRTRRARRAEQTGGPVVVHCSAGVGRAGTFIAASLLDEKLRLGVALSELEESSMVAAMRTQRAGCIQTTEQFAFLRRVLADRSQYWERVRSNSITAEDADSSDSDDASLSSDVPSDEELPDDTDAFLRGASLSCSMDALRPTRQRDFLTRTTAGLPVSIDLSTSPAVEPQHSKLASSASSPVLPSRPALSLSGSTTSSLRLSFNFSLGLEHPERVDSQESLTSFWARDSRDVTLCDDDDVMVCSDDDGLLGFSPAMACSQATQGSLSSSCDYREVSA